MYNHKVVSIDFKKISSSSDLHKFFKSEFGFPDFYGMNINALIDCLSDLRIPGEDEEVMVSKRLSLDEIIVLNASNLSSTNKSIIEELIIAIEEVNNRSINYMGVPSILLLLW